MRLIRKIAAALSAYVYIASSMFVVGPVLAGRGDAAGAIAGVTLACALALVLSSYYFRRQRLILLGLALLSPCYAGLLWQDDFSIAAEFLVHDIFLLLIWQAPVNPDSGCGRRLQTAPLKNSLLLE